MRHPQTTVAGGIHTETISAVCGKEGEIQALSPVAAERFLVHPHCCETSADIVHHGEASLLHGGTHPRHAWPHRGSGTAQLRHSGGACSEHVHRQRG